MDRFTEVHEPVTIFCIPSGPLETNAYLIACNNTKRAAIIDPAPQSAPLIFKTLKEKQLSADAIILTHTHWDHIADVAEIKKELNIAIFVHEEDAQNLTFPGSDGLAAFFELTPEEPTKFLKDGDQLSIGESIWSIIHTPGHSPGGVCLFCKEAAVLLSGDTLFKGAIGRLDLPTSEPERMWSSIEKLQKLPKNTRVFPGHGAPTTLEAEGWLSRAKELFS